MKPSKESKGVPSKQQQEKSGGTAENSDNPGALFPRLHVKETKNVGPRAPPRNKMALYEQLTVPSHKFPQPSPQQHNGAPTPAPVPTRIPPYLPQSFTGGYYLPYYMGPPMAFQAMNGGCHMLGQQPQPDWDQSELQRVPGVSVADSTGHCHRISASLSNTNSGKRKKARDDQGDFTVPTCFSTKAGSLFSKEQEVALAVPTSTTAQESHLQSQASGFSAVMHNASCEIRETSGTENQSSSGIQSVRNFKGPDLQRCTSQTPKQNKAETGSGNAISSHSRSTVAVNNGSHVADHREFTSSKQQRLFHSPSSSFENNGDIDNQSDEEPAEPSELEEREASGDSETSMLDMLTAAKVTTKEIMSAIGDHEFWKMRKAMQRQQRLFHAQLFELHRLTKVQQLMASSGITDDDADSGNAAAKPEKVVETRVERSKPSMLQLPKDPEPSPHTESPAYERGSCPPVCPVMHGTNPGLGYAPYPGFAGVNQWYVGYAYPQHFAGPVAAVGAFNSPYGPVFSGPGPMPFVPFPMPGYEQRHEHLRDPRYNVAAPPVHPWQASAGPNFVSDPGSQWMGYPRPFMIPSPSSQQPYVVTAGNSNHPTVPVIPTQPPNEPPTGTSPGFNLIQRAEAAQAGNPKTMQKQQVKLGGRRQENAGAGCPRPYAFQPLDGERTQQNACEGGRGIKVIPKATMVTPESAAGILQTIQQERL